MFLSNFKKILPPYSYQQDIALEWLAALHAQVETEKKDNFAEVIKRLIEKVCCKKERIATRYFVADEFCKTQGLSDFKARSDFFSNFADKIFEQFYPHIDSAPDDLIHVTCTGYNAPSAAQKLTSKRGWKETLVTHAYHMGCMAAIPAIRIAKGFAMSGKKRVDIVHTEMCSLHFNPSLHTAEQLVAQSLFADGFIKYSVSREPSANKGYELLTTDEEIIPNTEDKMKWDCEHWGMKMTLSKDIPQLISNAIISFIEKLEKQVKLSLKEAYYAIHPGGPKIIDMIKDVLSLNDEQTRASEKVLHERGNISSATLPTIWNEILEDERHQNGRLVVGLSFGPGLCMCGAVLKIHG